MSTADRTSSDAELGLLLMLSAAELIDEAVEETGLSDFGGESFRDGLERLTEALAAEGSLNEMGEQIFTMRLRGPPPSRLRVEDTIKSHPAIAGEVVEGPIVI